MRASLGMGRNSAKLYQTEGWLLEHFLHKKLQGLKNWSDKPAKSDLNTLGYIMDAFLCQQDSHT